MSDYQKINNTILVLGDKLYLAEHRISQLMDVITDLYEAGEMARDGLRGKPTDMNQIESALSKAEKVIHNER